MAAGCVLALWVAVVATQAVAGGTRVPRGRASALLMRRAVALREARERGLAPSGTFNRSRGPLDGGVPSFGRSAGHGLRERRRGAAPVLGPEDPSFRTRYSRTFLASSGAFVTRVYSAPVNFRDGRGRWQPIDNTLVASGAVAVNRAADYRVAIPRSLGSGPVRISSRAGAVDLSLVGGRGTGAVVGSRERFASALPGVAATYRATGEAVKESLTLAGPGSPTRFTYRLGLTPGLSPRMNKSGRIDVADPRGRVRFSLLAPYMVDASARPGDVGRVRMRLRRAGSGWAVVISADRRWLSARGRRWPVTIDPTVNVGPAPDCSLEAGTPTSSFCAGMVDEVGGGSSPDHTLLYFPVGGTFPSDSEVQFATVAMYLNSAANSTTVPVGVYALTRGFTSAATWKTYDGTNSWTTAGGDYSSGSQDTENVPSTAGWNYWYPSNLARNWAAGTQNDVGVVLKEPDDSVANTLQFAGSADPSNAPYLQVTWQPRTGEPSSGTIVRQQLASGSFAGVNVANGNLLVEESDLELASRGMDDVFHRTYNSLDDGWFVSGAGWRSPFDESLLLPPYAAPGQMIYAAPDGQQFIFDGNGSGGFIAPSDLNATLVHNPSSDGFPTHDSYTLTFQSGLVETFNHWGGLVTQTDPSGDNINWQSGGANGALQQIVDTQGRATTTSVDPSDFFIDSFTDPTGRAVSYSYDTSQRMTSATTPSGKTTYAYDSSNNLSQITDPSGNVTKFTYSNGHQLASIIQVTDPSAGTGPTTTFAYYGASGAPISCGAVPSGVVPYGETIETQPGGAQTAWCYDNRDVVWATVGSAPSQPQATFDTPSVSPSWTDASATVATQGHSPDPGLTSVDLWAGPGGQSPVPPHSGQWSTFCTGTVGVECPKDSGPVNLNLDTTSLPEGVNTLDLAAKQSGGSTADQPFQVNIDRQAPNAPTPSGAVWDDRYDPTNNPSGSSSSNPMTGARYAMQITGVDPGSASGPAEFDVSVDGGTPTVLTAPCVAASSTDPAMQCGTLVSGTMQATVTYMFENNFYAAGEHSICVTVKDEYAVQQNTQISNCGSSPAAHTNQTQFNVWTAPMKSSNPLLSSKSGQTSAQNDQLGLESFYDYRKIATGAGSYARVNLATGNMVWDDVPMVDPGQGLSTFVEVVYNSQHRLGGMFPLANQPLAPNPEYHEIGPGFSLGIDGLTRLNEPIDVKKVKQGMITFRDVDGTLHVFMQDPSNSQHWIAPPGVFLWLRQWSTTDPTKAWAITRPDGVTFFYDDDGYERSIEDRQGNTLSFQNQSIIKDSQQGGVKNCPRPLPQHGNGCTERTLDVVDQNGQDMHVCYYGVDTQAGCPGAAVPHGDKRVQKVEDVIDHAGHDLHFDYDSAGNLTQMTVNNEAGANAKRVFKFCYVATNATSCSGQDAAPDPSALEDGKSDLTSTALHAAPTVSGITDPNGNTTSFKYCAPGAVDSGGNKLACTQNLPAGQSSPCPQDISQPVPPSLGGLVALEPKCVIQVTDRGGGVTNFSYTTGTDSSGNEIHTADVNGPRSDPPGSSTHPDHWVDTTDAFGRPTKEVDPLGRTRLLAWNNTGGSQPGNTLASLVEASGTSDQVTTLYSYDQNGRLTDRQGPAKPGESQNFREVSIHYQLSAGTLTAPSGADTAHCSSADSSLCFVSDPTSLTNQDHQTTQFTPDPANPDDGLVTKVTDPAGQAWSTTYDQFGRVTSQTEPGTSGPVTTTFGSFDPNTGLPQTKTVASGTSSPSTWHYAYDKLGNLLAITDPRNTTLGATAPAPTTPGSAFTTTFTYDALSRVTARSESKDSTASQITTVNTSYTYDPNDNMTAKTDGNGKVFSYTFTPMDWLSSQSTPPITQADGTTKPAEITSYCYDEQGDQTDQVQPLGQPGTCALGQPAALNHATHLVYDADGEQLVSEKMGSAAGATNELTSYAYDNRGDQVGMADPVDNAGQTITQAEQNAQAATSGTAGPWRTNTLYDAAGNAIQTTQNPQASDNTAYTSRNQYDAASRLLATEDARGPTVSLDASTGEFDLSASPVVADTTVYGYDSRGLLDQVTDPAGDSTQIERAADGKICAITAPNGPSGVSESDCGASPGNYKTTFSYFPQGWLQQIGLPTAPNEYAYGTDTMTVAYGRDAAGYPTTITDPRGNVITNSFYDSGELKTTNRPSWWTFDPQGQGTPSPDPNTGGDGQVSSDTPGGGLPLREKTLQEIYQAAAQQQNQVIPAGQTQRQGSSGQGGRGSSGQASSGPGAQSSAPSAQGGKFGQVPAQKLPGILPPAGGTSFAYDGNWNLTSVTDALQSANTTSLRYDELSEPIEIDRPFDGTNQTKTYYSYDADGNQLTSDTPQVTDAGQTPSDTKFRTTNTYDGLDRLTETDAPGSAAVSGGSPITRTTTYCYALAPANGTSPCTPTSQPSENVSPVAGTKSGQTFAIARRVAVVAPSNTSTSGAQDNVTYKDYDALGNLLSQIAPPPSAGGTAPQTTYAYDPIGDQTEALRPLGQPSQNSGTANTAFATTMAYDAAGRLQSSTRNNTETTSYSYDHDSNVSQIRRPGAFATSGLPGTPPNQVTNYTYNGRDLLWRTTTGTVTTGSGADKRTTVTEYDGDGNPIRTVNPAGVDSTGVPFNTYDDSYKTDTSSATSASAQAANLDATIRVYTPTNALTDVYEPWAAPWLPAPTRRPARPRPSRTRAGSRCTTTSTKATSTASPASPRRTTTGPRTRPHHLRRQATRTSRTTG
jgi:YD repeat-containing protein